MTSSSFASGAPSNAFFFAPPFNIGFNTNSSACAGQRFVFQCRADPINYGINLTLYQLDARFSLTTLEDAAADGAVDFRNSNTLLLQVDFLMDISNAITALGDQGERDLEIMEWN